MTGVCLHCLAKLDESGVRYCVDCRDADRHAIQLDREMERAGVAPRAWSRDDDTEEDRLYEQR